MITRTVLTGEKFGRLTIVREAARGSQNRRRFHCKCECGNKTMSLLHSLIVGHSTSCGCKRIETLRARATHRDGKSVEYGVWAGMIERCENPRSTSYIRYGGKGISVCRKWRNSYVAFLADMGRRPSRLHSIDRINTYGNYEPSNCRWATKWVQSNNMSSNKPISAFGKRLNAAEWGKENGIKAGTIRARLKLGWSKERVVTMPAWSYRANRKLVWFNGKKESVFSLAKKFGHPVSRVMARLEKGLSIRDALTNPVQLNKARSKKRNSN